MSTGTGCATCGGARRYVGPYLGPYTGQAAGPGVAEDSGIRCGPQGCAVRATPDPNTAPAFVLPARSASIIHLVPVSDETPSRVVEAWVLANVKTPAGGTTNGWILQTELTDINGAPLFTFRPVAPLQFAVANDGALGRQAEPGDDAVVLLDAPRRVAFVKVIQRGAGYLDGHLSHPGDRQPDLSATIAVPFTAVTELRRNGRRVTAAGVTNAAQLFAAWQRAKQNGRQPAAIVSALYRQYSAAAAQENRPAVDASYTGPLPQSIGTGQERGRAVFDYGGEFAAVNDGSLGRLAAVGDDVVVVLEPFTGRGFGGALRPRTRSVAFVTVTAVPSDQAGAGYLDGMLWLPSHRRPDTWNPVPSTPVPFTSITEIHRGGRRVTAAGVTNAAQLFAAWQRAKQSGRQPAAIVSSLYRQYSAAAAQENRPAVDASYTGPLPQPTSTGQLTADLGSVTLGALATAANLNLSPVALGLLNRLPLNTVADVVSRTRQALMPPPPPPPVPVTLMPAIPAASTGQVVDRALQLQGALDFIEAQRRINARAATQALQTTRGMVFAPGGVWVQAGPGPLNTALTHLPQFARFEILQDDMPQSGAPPSARMRWWYVRTLPPSVPGVRFYPINVVGWIRAIGPDGEPYVQYDSPPIAMSGTGQVVDRALELQGALDFIEAQQRIGAQRGLFPGVHFATVRATPELFAPVFGYAAQGLYVPPRTAPVDINTVVARLPAGEIVQALRLVDIPWPNPNHPTLFYEVRTRSGVMGWLQQNHVSILQTGQ